MPLQTPIPVRMRIDHEMLQGMSHGLEAVAQPKLDSRRNGWGFSDDVVWRGGIEAPLEERRADSAIEIERQPFAEGSGGMQNGARAQPEMVDIIGVVGLPSAGRELSCRYEDAGFEVEDTGAGPQCAQRADHGVETDLDRAWRLNRVIA